MDFNMLQHKCKRLLAPTAGTLNWIGALVLLLMMFLTITDVVLRKLFSQSILGTVEISEFMLVIVVFFAFADTEMHNAHVKVDLFVRRLNHRSQSGLDIATQSAGAVLSGMMAWSTFLYGLQMKAAGDVSQDLSIAIYPFVFLAAFGFALLTVCLVYKVAHAVLEVIRS